jgi:hypothetical protein
MEHSCDAAQHTTGYLLIASASVLHPSTKSLLPMASVHLQLLKSA